MFRNLLSFTSTSDRLDSKTSKPVEATSLVSARAVRTGDRACDMTGLGPQVTMRLIRAQRAADRVNGKG